LLGERAIGNVISVRAECGEYLPAWHPYEDYRTSFAARSDLGGGVLLTQVHEFDYLLWLFGMPQRLFAVGGHLSNLEIDVEDTATVLMDMAVENRRIPVQVHHDFLQLPFRRSCTVVGDRGQITIDLRRAVLEWTGPDGTLRERDALPEFHRNRLFLEEMEQFLGALRGAEKPAVSLADGARALAIAIAAKESMRTGAAVDPRTILSERVR
jgi:predicted dehydrogenase